VSAADLVIVGVAGTRLLPAEARALRRYAPAGIILFGRNLETAAQLRSLVRELRGASPGALLCLDAEGGRVHRLRALVGPAPAAERLAAAPAAASRRAGVWMGRALRHFDFDVDFAPVVDLDHGHLNNALDGRYLGSTPRAVEARAGQFLAGLRTSGIGGCLKHFPGLGAAQADTHASGAPIPLSRRELERDLRPFSRLGAAAGAVMISHANYPALDASGSPATLSRLIATDLLRRDLGFRGVAFSDDMEMKALAARGELPDLAAGCLAAGCDVLAICGAQSLEALPSVARALGRGGLADRREEARKRLLRYRRGISAARRKAPVADLDSVVAALERQVSALEAPAS
jgi:beta-N-acetylhexosaminidase